MARTNNLTNFLNDVSSAIKQKTGDSTPIPASEFDTEILSIETVGTYQSKSITIDSNGTQVITPDENYDAIEQLVITVNVPVSQLQSKAVTITSNGNISVLPDTDYNGMAQVDLTVSVPSQEINNQDKTITQNGTYTADSGYTGLGEVTVNVPSGSGDFNAKMLTSIADTTADLSKYIVNIPVLDTSNIRNMNNTFHGCSALAEVPLLNTSNVTTMNSAFYGCSLLTSIPLFITSNVTSMSNIFKNCTSLVDVPVFDTSALINMTNMFSSCPNLSNNSLNNILTMCINASSFNGVKTLKTLGLTSAQATTCQSLENYQDFIDAGWKTGY